ncbi:MAG: Rrf2 family transcriptional regulator [Spirochaetaceae bacterium]|jgi:Rrf2 family protein|nr:Rrf2 family transcriptional regulator [Spirochaetaceae bacterium]
MKVSTRGKYGMRLLLDLAHRSSETHVTLASVAQRQGISVRYLEQVAIILRRSGIIRSVKGAQGGYALARKPDEIILGDILRSLEGDMLIIDPPLDDEPETRLQRCVRATVFDKINERIAEVIDGETLADLAGILPVTDMYFI